MFYLISIKQNEFNFTFQTNRAHKTKDNHISFLFPFFFCLSPTIADLSARLNGFGSVQEASSFFHRFHFQWNLQSDTLKGFREMSI